MLVYEFIILFCGVYCNMFACFNVHIYDKEQLSISAATLKVEVSSMNNFALSWHVVPT